MPIIIEDPETLRLIQRLAELTGESMDEVIVRSVRQKLKLESGECTEAELIAEDLALIHEHRKRLQGDVPADSPSLPRDQRGDDAARE